MEYKTKFTCNIDTSTLGPNVVTHNFSVPMENQLAFHRDHEYEMALLRYDIYNSIKNISAENLNNEIKIDPAIGSFVTITITDGVYSISELNTAIKTKVSALGYDSNNISIIGDFNILKVLLTLGAGWKVDFSGNSLYKILGFNQVIYDHNIGVANIAPNKADISNGKYPSLYFKTELSLNKSTSIHLYFLFNILLYSFLNTPVSKSLPISRANKLISILFLLSKSTICDKLFLIALSNWKYNCCR